MATEADTPFQVERQKVLDFLASLGLEPDAVCGMLILPQRIVIKSYVFDQDSGKHVIVNDPETGYPAPDTKFEHFKIID